MHNHSTDVTKVKIDIETKYEKDDYAGVINTYEKLDENIFDYLSGIEKIDFFDLLLISYKENNMYQNALSIIDDQIVRINSISDDSHNRVQERKMFYFLILSEISNIKRHKISECLALKYYIHYGGNQDKHLNRYKSLLSEFSYMFDKIIGLLFLLFAIEIFFIRISPNILHYIFLSIILVYFVIIFTNRSSVSNLILMLVSKFGIHLSMYPIKKAIIYSTSTRTL